MVEAANENFPWKQEDGRWPPLSAALSSSIRHSKKGGEEKSLRKST